MNDNICPVLPLVRVSQGYKGDSLELMKKPAIPTWVTGFAFMTLYIYSMVDLKRLISNSSEPLPGLMERFCPPDSAK